MVRPKNENMIMEVEEFGPSFKMRPITLLQWSNQTGGSMHFPCGASLGEDYSQHRKEVPIGKWPKHDQCLGGLFRDLYMYLGPGLLFEVRCMFD